MLSIMLRSFACIVLVTCLLGGCGSSSSQRTFEVAAGNYRTAFDATRDVLREGRFELDRVDAGEGVITTQAKQTSGLATPWDSEQSSLSQEIEDMVHAQQRRVRVTFTTAAGEGATFADSACTGRVEVVLERVQLVGWQPSSKAILQSGFTTDPIAQAAGRDARYEVPVARDDALAARIAERIRDRVEKTRGGQASTR